MIELSGVSKVYRTAHGEVRALDDVTLSIREGEFVALKGHSGSGKSTLLALMGGLALPNEGSVSVAGCDVEKLSSSERARFREDNVGFVFQMFHLLPYLSVLDNVLVAAPASGRSASRETAKQLLSDFGMAARITHRPSQLSAGERQRVAMARALLNRPKLLLADEPTGNLDENNAEAVLDYLTSFHKAGGTIVLATHDERAAERADRIIELSSGKVTSAVATK
ncbi:MAG: ABC transporter ATP-binding protein [Planctomycetaceae bacterium]|nr:ABC transporter ATP-binding protein [Planctomycetales bacterium]MCB9925724.1 ABC transporter ATP-binding protein [Planctomycetaceae bacterium]